MLPFKPWLVNHIVVGKAWETQLFTFELHFNFTGFSDEPLAKNTTSLPLLHVVLSDTKCFLPLGLVLSGNRAWFEMFLALKRAPSAMIR